MLQNYKIYSFVKGWGELQRKDTAICRERIKKSLGISTHVTWLRRLNGLTPLRLEEFITISSIFKDYGVSQPWDQPEINQLLN